MLHTLSTLKLKTTDPWDSPHSFLAGKADENKLLFANKATVERYVCSMPKYIVRVSPVDST